MLQLLDDGQVTDSKGTKVDFKNCIVIFTSNIGSQDIIELGGADGDQALMKERVFNAMRANVSRYCTTLISDDARICPLTICYVNLEVPS